VTHRRGSRRRWLLEGSWTFGVWLVGALVFYRAQLTSGFKWLRGDPADTVLAAYLCEHWFRVFHGQASWLSPSFFYPLKGVLGWSDTFFLYEIFYAPLRLLGCDMFLALQLTVILFSLVGFASFVYLVRLGFGTPLPAALVCGLIFTFSNALWVHSVHVQLTGVYLVPAIFLVGWLGWRAAAGRRVWLGALLTGAAGLLWALLLFSAYYIGWFSTLAVGIALVFLVIMGRGPLIREAIAALRKRRTAVVCGCAGLVAGLIPFARTYLPARHPTTYASALHYAGHVRDLANVGQGNIIWSELLKSTLKARASMYEVSYAVTPLVMFLALAGAGLAAWLLLAGRQARLSVARLAVALTGTAVITAILPLNTRFGSAWATVWHLPGASALRAIDRLQLVTGMLAILAIAAAASEAWVLVTAANRRAVWHVSVLALLLVAAAEQLNTSPTSHLNRVAQVNLLRSAKAPPRRCRAFFVTVPGAGLPYVEYQLDAMLVSEKVSLPTLNGYTAHFPPGWGLANPSLPSYPRAVSDWADAHGITSGLCRLDLGTMRWAAAGPAGVAARSPEGVPRPPRPGQQGARPQHELPAGRTN
jgi:hypothetical protein